MSLVTIDGTSLNIVPFPPEKPVKEILQWKTDILESYSGTEQRLQVRNHPRQSFLYYTPATYPYYTGISNTFWQGTASYWAIPVWTEATVVGTLPKDATSITVATSYGDYRIGSSVFVWQDPANWEVAKITNKTDNVLVLEAGLSRDYTKAHVMPLRKGRVTQGAEKRTNGFSTIHKLVCDIEDNTSLATDEPEQFQGEDVFLDEGLLKGGSITFQMRKKVTTLDPSLGLVAFKSLWENSRTRRPFSVLLENPEQVWQFRKWLHRRAGKYKLFWQPSFDIDFIPVSQGIVSSILDVAGESYVEHATTRKHIAIQADSGTWYFRTIQNAVKLVSGDTRLTLDQSLDIQAEDIVRICYFGLWRLDTDQVELNWIGGGICESSVNTVELGA